MWFGSGKLANPWGGAKYQYFAQLGENGEVECQTNCISDWYSEDLHLHMVMLPDYADEEREVTVTEEMMAQGVFIRYDNQWYFRLTEGQYNEVTAAFLEAYNWAGEEIYKVTYTYDELFGSFSTSQIQMYDEFLNGERCIGDNDIYDYITPTGESDRSFSQLVGVYFNGQRGVSLSGGQR